MGWNMVDSTLGVGVMAGFTGKCLDKLDNQQDLAGKSRSADNIQGTKFFWTGAASTARPPQAILTCFTFGITQLLRRKIALQVPNDYSVLHQDLALNE
jgi:hypothetical protein